MYKQKKFLGLVAYFLFFLVMGHGSFTTEVFAVEKQPAIVLASIKPLALIIHPLVKGLDIHVQTLIPASAPAHHHALKPSDRRAIHTAKLVVGLGYGHEPYLDTSHFSSTFQFLPLLEQFDSVDLLTEGLAGENQSRHKTDSHKIDPHFWLDPSLASQAADLITEELKRHFPQHLVVLEQNLATFRGNLDVLAQKLNKEIVPYQQAKFFTYHRAYDYVFRYYQIEGSLGVVYEQPGAGLGLKTVSRLQKQIEGFSKEGKQVCLFIEPQFSQSQLPPFFNSHQVVKKGALDPLGVEANSYEELQQGLINQWLECVAGKLAASSEP